MLLPPDTADLWIAAIPADGFDSVMTRVADRLTDEEREAANRFHSERHRVLYARSHAFLRAVLRQYLDRKERDIEIVYGEHGRPELADRAIRFNLSHTLGIATVGIALTDIGVDVEHVDGRRRLDDLARRIFTAAELQSWDGRPETFFARWTLKEAYAKARGLGLTIGFHDFGFELTDPPQLQCDPERDDPAEWRLLSLDPLPGFRAAAAVRSRAQIVWRRFDRDLIA